MDNSDLRISTRVIEPDSRQDVDDIGCTFSVPLQVFTSYEFQTVLCEINLGASILENYRLTVQRSCRFQGENILKLLLDRQLFGFTALCRPAAHVKAGTMDGGAPGGLASHAARFAAPGNDGLRGPRKSPSDLELC